MASLADQSKTLRYGMKISLVAKSPVGADTKTIYNLTNFDKHDLVSLHDSPAIVFTLVSTNSNSSDVCYGDRVILVDDRGLVLNGESTGTWGNGYITLKPRGALGELHLIFSKPSSQLSKGSPILLDDIKDGGKIQVHAIKARGQPQQPQLTAATAKNVLTVERSAASSCKGGYIRRSGHGSGQVIGFDIRVVSAAPMVNNASGLTLATPTTSTQATKTPVPPTPSGPHNDDDDEAIPVNNDPNNQYHSKGVEGRESVNPKRDLQPNIYNLNEEVKPLRYGDRIRLIARSAYYGEGGPVGLYRKHDLIGVAPVLKNGQPIEEGDNDYDGEFVVSEFIICATGNAQMGDIVRYSTTCVLVDATNGNAVWNCKSTDTWTNGYIAEGPMVQNGMQPTPGTAGQALVSCNFNSITLGGKLPTGQVHISFQPDATPLLGHPIYNKDTNISIDLEDTHQKKGSLNTRLSVYKKKSSLLAGGYLICLPNSGKPVSFTVERIVPVPIVRAHDAFVNKLLLAKPQAPHGKPTIPTCPQTTTHYRPSAEYEKKMRRQQRSKWLSTFSTLILTIFALMYAWEYAATPKLVATDGDVVAEPINFFFGFLTVDTLSAYLYTKQLFYMVCTLLAAVCAFSYGTSSVTEHANHHHVAQSLTSAGHGLDRETTLAQQQTMWRVKQGELIQVQVEQNTLQHLVIDAQQDGKGNDPFAWMVEAGLDPDNLIVPERYVNAEKGDEAKGKKRFIITAKWRWINRLDTILDRPHPLFRIIKKNTVQFFCGKDKKGNCVYYETPKAAKLPDLEAAGVTIEELLFHFVYITEYLYQRMDDRLDARCVSVVDLNGIGLSDFGGKVVEFVQAVSKVTQTHYPERSAGILCVNAGFAFRAIWAVVAPMMDPVTRSKTHLWGSNFVEQMAEIVPMNQIPKMFGGTCQFTPSIPAAGPTLPQGSVEPQFNAIAIAPLSKEEEDMFKICDKANQTWAAEHPGEMLPRTVLKDKA